MNAEYTNKTKDIGFLFGAQYYRAPTPGPECWEYDLARMKELGFNSVKFWVQWRWSHREECTFYFDDLDRLMDLAQKHELGVTLNVIVDQSPVWLYPKYPDAKQIINDGTVLEPYENQSRQSGGFSGPCLVHPQALDARRQFYTAAVEHFRAHPALAMWDVWNEPELCGSQRCTSGFEKLACYCGNCRTAFLSWLRDKYVSLEVLNDVWGRCYTLWDQVELPRTGTCVTDFIDWREFHIDTVTQEARWRLALVRDLDRTHPAYLHVVPNVIGLWNTTSGATDDFALAEDCDIYGGSLNGEPSLITQLISAGRGKRVYNMESHINFGSASAHQRILSIHDVCKDMLPQVGAGIQGFLFWQYRPESLGTESPCWGIVNSDGSDRSVTGSLATFWKKLQPHVDKITQCRTDEPAVGLWKSRKNEVFHYSLFNSVDFRNNIQGYIDTLYWNNLAFRVVTDDDLRERRLEGLKVLIMPNPYYLTEAEAEGLQQWIEQGGVCIAEAHCGGYNGTRGRHSPVMPGCGLADAWRLRESESTSPIHLKLGDAENLAWELTDDAKKAMGDSVAGSRYVPLKLDSGEQGFGADRYAILSGDSMEEIGTTSLGHPCIAVQKAGKGTVFYCGTNLGTGVSRDPKLLATLIGKAASSASVAKVLSLETSEPGTLHADVLRSDAGPEFLMLRNRSDHAVDVHMALSAQLQGIYTGKEYSVQPPEKITVPGDFVDLFRVG